MFCYPGSEMAALGNAGMIICYEEIFMYLYGCMNKSFFRLLRLCCIYCMVCLGLYFVLIVMIVIVFKC